MKILGRGTVRCRTHPFGVKDSEGHGVLVARHRQHVCARVEVQPTEPRTSLTRSLAPQIAVRVHEVPELLLHALGTKGRLDWYDVVTAVNHSR